MYLLKGDQQGSLCGWRKLKSAVTLGVSEFWTRLFHGLSFYSSYHNPLTFPVFILASVFFFNHCQWKQVWCCLKSTESDLQEQKYKSYVCESFIILKSWHSIDLSESLHFHLILKISF